MMFSPINGNNISRAFLRSFVIFNGFLFKVQKENKHRLGKGLRKCFILMAYFKTSTTRRLQLFIYSTPLTVFISQLLLEMDSIKAKNT